jgi:hypothetical protein
LNALDKLSRLTPDLASTLARFPVPALASLLLCIYANLDAEKLVADGWSTGEPVYAAGAAAFLAAGAGDYFATGRGWTRGSPITLSLIAAVIAGAVTYFGQFTHPQPLFLFAGIVLLLMMAGFLHKGASQGALWFFNLRLGLTALLAAIVGLVFVAGLAAIVESLNFLFEFNLPSELYNHIWATGLALVGPIYGLSLAPRGLTEEIDLVNENATLIERGVSVLVNYVLVPIAVIYAAILHAYAVKIALAGTLPKGQIGAMVTIFALGGTAAWIIAWPWRDKGTRLLRWFMRGWFWFTIVPTILLILATWQRLADYGVTPDRYGLAVIAIWLIIIAAYLAFRRNRADMRLILGSLAILLLIGSAGPWGANGLSISSQFARLTNLLAAGGFLTNTGKIADPMPKWTEDSRSESYSMLQVLREADGLDRLKPWFEGRKDDPFATGAKDWNLYSKIASALDLADWPQKLDFVSFTANVPVDRGIAASGRLIGPIRVVERFGPPQPQDDMTAVANDQTLTVKVGDRSWSYPVRDIMDKAKAVSANQQKVAPFIIDAAADMSLIFVSVSGEAGDKPKLRTAEIWLILRQ